MPSVTSDIDYSIVICTYNPDERLLKRCLKAVASLDTNNLNIEVIVVDNNSAVRVESLPYVKTYAEKIPSMCIINVAEQGVNQARMAAIEKAKGNYTIYFDYDNEPKRDYLQELKKLNEQHPDVAAWGPGQVWVDFIDGIDPAIESYARVLFQERHETQLAFGATPEWQPCYPFGTGLCTHTSLLKEYVVLARQGLFTLSGRKGNRLSSGEDTQMILLCIRNGYAVGVSPALKLTHMIPDQRANYAYIVRLIHGINICYETCVLQVFPQYKEKLEQKRLAKSKFIRRSLARYLKAVWSKNPRDQFDLVQFIASQTGVYLALTKPVPFVITRLVNSLNVD